MLLMVQTARTVQGMWLRVKRWYLISRANCWLAFQKAMVLLVDSLGERYVTPFLVSRLKQTTIQGVTRSLVALIILHKGESAEQTSHRQLHLHYMIIWPPQRLNCIESTMKPPYTGDTFDERFERLIITKNLSNPVSNVHTPLFSLQSHQFLSNSPLTGIISWSLVSMKNTVPLALQSRWHRSN